VETKKATGKSNNQRLESKTKSKRFWFGIQDPDQWLKKENRERNTNRQET
jgi:hypothetical protein